MLREFKTFIAVARQGSFTAAGRALGLTQSAVSAQIQRLEDALGVRLFDRTARAAVLNGAGREVLAQAEQFVAMVERMADPAGKATAGTLRMGAIASVQQGVLVRALAAFRDEYPDVRVRVVPGVSLNLLGLVDSGEVELAVLIRPPYALPADLVWHELAREPIVLVAPAGAPRLSWRELLAALPFIRYDRASFGGRVVDGLLRRLRITVKESVELDEIDAIASLVRQGLGVALLPWSARMSARGLRVIPLPEAGAFREIGIVHRQGGPTPAAAHMARCLQKAAQAEPAPEPKAGRSAR